MMQEDKIAGEGLFPGLNIQIPTHREGAYQAAIRSGNLHALKSVLIASCTAEQVELVEHFLPTEMLAKEVYLT